MSFKHEVRLVIEGAFQKIWDFSYPAMKSVQKPLLETRADIHDSSIITQGIQSGAPFCVSRFGRTELQLVQHYRVSRLFGRKASLLDSMAMGDPMFYFIRARQMAERAGLAQLSDGELDRFYDEVVGALPDIDVLGSWAPGETWFKKELENVQLIPFLDLEPYRSKNPWSRALAGRSVLIVHPYATSIEEQYKQHREKIFESQEVLPDFEIQTLVPPRAYLGEVKRSGWFNSLEDLTNQVLLRSFDIALIGAGPFGMPLAVSVKRAGRQAIHLGGALQLLFGIMGSRWETDPKIMSLHNSFWIRPKGSDTPADAATIDRSAYW